MSEAEPLNVLLNLALKAAERLLSYHSSYGSGGEYSSVDFRFEVVPGENLLSIRSLSIKSIELQADLIVIRKFDSCSARKNYQNKETTRREARAKVVISSEAPLLEKSEEKYQILGHLVEGEATILWSDVNGYNRSSLSTEVSSNQLLELLRRYPAVVFECPTR